MSLSFPYPERVPANAVTRLLKNMADLIAAMDAVLASAETAPFPLDRLHRAIALLRQEQAGLSLDAEAFRKGKREPLLQRVAELRLLARRMDGYTSLLGAEDTLTEVLAKRQLVVLTSWQIAAAASGSEAAGL